MSVNEVNETVYFRLTLASPVHVGCGEVYEPMNFVVDEESLELVTFDTGEFMSLLTEDELNKLSSICRKGTVASLQELYKFMRQHRHVAKGTRINIPSALVNHYREVLEKEPRRFARELNQFEINRTSFNFIEDEPVIPGSAIKGAIRTAVLNFRNKGANQPRFRGRNASRDMEEHLLDYSFRNMGTDPFRLVKVSDFMPCGNVKRRICYAVDLKKRPSDRDASAFDQMQEVIESGSSFWGSITVVQAPRSIKRPVTLEEIKNALSMFYGSEKDREDREVKGIQVDPVSIPEKNMPLRIGRHSGAECVTVKGHRHIRIMQGRGNPPKFKDHATTIWLASDNSRPGTMQGLTPMGWTGLRQMSADEVKNLQKERDTLREERLKHLEQQRQAAIKAEQERIARQQAEEERKRQEEERARLEQERQAELEEKWKTMSEAERAVFIVRGDEIARLQEPSKEAIRDIWPKLDTFEGEERKALALAFRELWENVPDKWRRRQCTTRQWEKVEQVVAILDIDHPDIKRISPQEQEQLEKINKLNDWGAFRNSGIEMKELCRPAAEALLKKFKEWGCAKKKAKKDKQRALKELQKYMRAIQD